MSDTPVDTSKRTWLIASGCAGAAGGVAVAVPFVSSFQPSEKAKAAGAAVEVDISALQPGEKLTVEWRGKPVWILKRTPEQIASLAKTEPQLADPKSRSQDVPHPLSTQKTNTAPSSLKSSWAWAFAPTWVARPAIEFQTGPQPSLPDDWNGGFPACLPRLHFRRGWPCVQEQACA